MQQHNYASSQFILFKDKILGSYKFVADVSSSQFQLPSDPKKQITEHNRPWFSIL